MWPKFEIFLWEERAFSFPHWTSFPGQSYASTLILLWYTKTLELDKHTHTKQATQGCCVCGKVCQSSHLCIFTGLCNIVCLTASLTLWLHTHGQCKDDDDDDDDESCEIHVRITVTSQTDSRVSLQTSADPKLTGRTDDSETDGLRFGSQPWRGGEPGSEQKRCAELSVVISPPNTGCQETFFLSLKETTPDTLLPTCGFV